MHFVFGVKVQEFKMTIGSKTKMETANLPFYHIRVNKNTQQETRCFSCKKQ
jgi:hypothetical protein